jgi:hypothetical protein
MSAARGEPVTARTNAPYEPVFYPDLPEPWRGLLARFLRFCEKLRIPSKEAGDPILILWDSQRYAIEEVFHGFSLGIHDFVILKGRQLGLSTLLWAFDLFWLTTFTLQAIYIADEEGNKEIHRDILGQMYLSLPASWSRGPWRQNNRWELNWSDRPKWTASRMMWAFANRRKEGQLGRSRGANYIHAEELDSWEDRTALGALTSARSESHPRRAYFWVGTGQGYGQLYELWDQAERGVTSRAIFIGFWRRTANRVTRAQTALWDAYGASRPTPEELEWGAEVARRYHYTVTRDQLAWWRYTKTEGKGINGDEAKMLQEHPWLPEQAFQASGSEFLGARTCLRLRTRLRDAPPAQHFVYHWGERFDSKGDDVLERVPADAATLTLWEEPEPGMVYVIAADPAYGSSPMASSYATTVWKCFPDALVQVAEYLTPLGAMYQFAWVLAHLGGLYRVASEDHLILEIGGPGRAVHEELERMAAYGYGMTKHSEGLQDVIGQIQHFLYRRVDSMTGAMAWHFNTTSETLIQIMEQLKDSVERGALVVRSSDLVTQLGALRRDEKTGLIEPGGVTDYDLAVTAALACHCWLQNVIPEIEEAVAPLTPPANAPRHTGESVLRTFLGGLRQQEGPVATTMRPRAPGR